MKKRLLPLLCASALALALTACGAQQTTQTDIADAVVLTFTDSGITAQDGTAGYEIDGTALTITESGIYAVSGSCADGTIQIKKGTTGVTLILNGLDLTSGDSAAITCGKSGEVTILAADGTQNALSDTEQNNDDNYPDNSDAENAVIKCKDGSAVTLGGTGALTVTANGKNGIKSGAATEEDGEASLTIRDLTLHINAPVNDAINAEQLLNVESGTLTIDAADDAIHCDMILNIGADGTDGPTIDITSCYEGLEGAELNVPSGNITINASDDLNAANSDLTGYAFTLTISGGTIDAYSSGGDGFDSNGELTITGGTVVVWTANTADNEPLDADGTITVTGGTVLAAGGSSGMGMSLEAAQPCVIYGASSLGGTPGSAQSGSLITSGADFTIEDSRGSTVYSGTARCNASFVLFSSADVTADGTYTLKAGDSSAEGTAQSGTVSTGMGMGGGFRGGQKPDGEPPEGFDGQQPSGEKPELPDGERPEPPDGQGKSKDGRVPAGDNASDTNDPDTTQAA